MKIEALTQWPHRAVDKPWIEELLWNPRGENNYCMFSLLNTDARWKDLLLHKKVYNEIWSVHLKDENSFIMYIIYKIIKYEIAFKSGWK